MISTSLAYAKCKLTLFESYSLSISLLDHLSMSNMLIEYEAY